MKIEPAFFHSYLQKKYQKLYCRLQNALRSGRFVRFTTAKKQQLLACLSRYERQLKHWGIALVTGTALSLPTAVSAQPVLSGGEFRVNTYTTEGQSFSAAAMESNGDFVIVWESDDQEGSQSGIYAQLYNSAGIPQGAEFLVNSFTTGKQRNASVAMDSDGDFVVAWESAGQVDGSYDIRAQRFDNTGMTQGSEFLVNTYVTFDQVRPSVAIDSEGDFVIAWDSDGQDGNQQGVYAQRFNSAGMAQGVEFLVNTYSTFSQFNPAVALDSDGDFIIVWASSGQDGNNLGVFAQRYNSAGIAQGYEFQVNTYTTFMQATPSVAMDMEGNYIIAWNSNGQDGNANGIYAQRYNSAGLPQGNEFLVNTYTTSAQFYPSVAMDSDGDFIIVWHSKGQDGSIGVYAQAYNSAGTTLGMEFRVNTYTPDNQQEPSVAMDKDGDFVVAWSSYNQDGNFNGIYAQRYEQTSGNTFIVYESETFSILSTFPIPVDNEIFLEINTLSDRPLTLMITDVLGRLLKKEIFNVQLGKNTLRTNLHDLPAGTYFIQLTDGENTIGTKVVKQ